MRLFIGGMRGSRPALGGAFEEFGGDTTSLLLIGSRGERLVLDAGTGMRAVAEQLAQTEPGKVTVLFSHYHLDHVAGLMMNPLFHKRDWSFNLVGPTFADGGVRDAVTRLLAPPYWPVSWEQMSAHFEFAGWASARTALPVPERQKPMLILRQNLHIRGCPVPHPGGCLAYRIDDASGAASVVFATDLEWRKRTPADEAAFLAMCREPSPADLLIMDAHFAEADQAAFAGWGHSCWEDCLAIARSAGVKRVLLGHHAPDADDKTLRAVEQQVKERTPGGMLARAGEWLTIDG
ncbi:MAG: MBL fold metallo-hydrolase [Sedimentisphaerales bacterium]|nr:MBL fold metallo-hydrolase [Sedimentisphaerales bacterium]